MKLEKLQCQNCGANLQHFNNVLRCPHCDTEYVIKKEQIQAIATPETAIDNETTQNKTNKQNKTSALLDRAIDEYKNHNYSDCKDFVNKILYKDPENVDAIIIKKLLIKQSNGRYRKPYFHELLSTVEHWLKLTNYKGSYIEEFLCKELWDSCSFSYLKDDLNNIETLKNVILENNIDSSYLTSFIKTLSLVEEFLQQKIKNSQEQKSKIDKIDKINKINKIVVLGYIIVAVVILAILITIGFVIDANVPPTIYATYHASTGGYIYVYSENAQYSQGYTYARTAGKTAGPVLAKPKNGYKFSHWSDNVTTAQRSDVIYENFEVTAYFVLDANNTNNQNNTSTTNYITLTYTTSVGGTIIGNATQEITKGSYGQEVTAKPNFGYYFTGWSDGENTTSRRDTSVNDSKTITALFEPYFAEGQGSSSDPFIINTAQQLQNINVARDDNTYDYTCLYYELGNNIDLSSFSCWKPLNFKGYFNGNSFTISNMTINNEIFNYLDNITYSIGLFGQLFDATIHHINVTNVSININGEHANFNCGIIAGTSSYSNIYNCSTSGTINIKSLADDYYSKAVHIAGIVGEADYASLITDCTSNVSMYGEEPNHSTNNPTVFISEIYNRYLEEIG